MADPTLEELARASSGSVDTDALSFPGLRGDRSRHLQRSALESAIAALPPPPRDTGALTLMVARTSEGDRETPDTVVLTREGGMPGDCWANQTKDGPTHQLATMRSDIAHVIANGQPLSLHGDNLYLTLDLSADNLPAGSLVRLGEALLTVTPQPHNGCKKWVQRFGLDALQLSLAPAYVPLRMRGIYFRVVEDGRVRLGDPAVVLSRTPG